MKLLRIEERHLDGISKIESRCFSEPWSRSSLELLLTESAFGVVAEADDGELMAYGGMTCVLDEGQITNIATLPEYRRQGLGRAVVLALANMARERGLCVLYLEVRASNAAAISLYESLGFVMTGKRTKFYKKPCEDAILMQLTL